MPNFTITVDGGPSYVAEYTTPSDALEDLRARFPSWTRIAVSPAPSPVDQTSAELRALVQKCFDAGRAEGRKDRENFLVRIYDESLHERHGSARSLILEALDAVKGAKS